MEKLDLNKYKLEENLDKYKVKKEPLKSGGIYKKGSTIEKITSFGSKASDFLFGSTSKTVGSLLGSGYESARRLVGKPVKEEKFLTEKGLPKYLTETSGKKQAVDIAFTALELMPGGGVLSKTLRKLPGGEMVAKSIKEAIDIIPEKMKAKAIEQYASIFKAGTKEMKGITRKVAPELLSQKKLITSPSKLKEEAVGKLTDIGSKIEKQISKLPKETKIEIGSAVSKLDELKNKYIVGGEIINKAKVDAIDNTKNIIAKFGNKIGFDDARKLRQILDEGISEAKGFTADTATKFSAKVDKILSDTIRNEIAKTSPDLAKLNSQYSLWSNVKKLAGYTAEKASGQALKRTTGGILGGIAGATQGDSFGQRIGGAAAGAWFGERAIRYINSPAWKSVSAVTKNKIADNILKGNFKAVNEIIRRLTTVLKNKLD